MSTTCLATVLTQKGVRRLAKLDLFLSIATATFWLYILLGKLILMFEIPEYFVTYKIVPWNDLQLLSFKRYMYLTATAVQVVIFGVEVYLFKLLVGATYSRDREKYIEWINIQVGMMLIAIIGFMGEIFTGNFDNISGVLLLKPIFRSYETFVVIQDIQELTDPQDAETSFI